MRGNASSGRLSLEILDSRLRAPFRIATQVIERWPTVIFRLEWDGLLGIGESAPFSRYGDSADAIVGFFGASARDYACGPFRMREYLQDAPRAARCGLDLALHDLLGKRTGLPLWRILGLEGLQRPPTSISIPVGSIDEMLARARELVDSPVLKIKVGTGGEIAFVEALRDFYRGAIRLDANEGWSPEQAVRVLHELERFDIELCEQPIAAGAPERLRWIRERVSMPIVADEDVLTAADVPRLAGCVDGVNVKLAKCGGLLAAFDTIAVARTLGMKVMIGCMIETKVLASAAAHIAPLADWLDVDGPLLLDSARFEGLTYDRGRVNLSDGPGLGVAERAG